MKRVLFLRASNGFFGAERVILNLAKVLPDIGWSVQVWVLEAPDSSHVTLVRELSQKGVSVEVINCRGRIDIGTIFTIRRRLKELASSETILHCHDVKSDFYGRLSTLGRDLPLVSTLHGWTSDTRSMRLYERVDRRILSSFDAVIAVSDSNAAIAAGLRGVFRVIGNGVDTREFRPESDGRLLGSGKRGHKQFLFGIFSRLTGEKGFDILLPAFAQVCRQSIESRLIITGNGPLKSFISDLADELEIADYVTMVPAHGRVSEALRKIDCYVSASHTEGMPMIVLEAMASGIPIVATAVGSVPQMLGDGCGLVVPPGDPDALAAAMIQVLRNGRQRSVMAVSALKRARERYSIEEQARRYAEVYEEAVRLTRI